VWTTVPTPAEEAASVGSYRVVCEAAAAAISVRILGDTSRQDVLFCLREREATVERNFPQSKLNMVLAVDQAAHGSVAVLRLIRRSLENQTHRDCLAGIVGVSGDAAKVATSRSVGADMLLFGEEGRAQATATRRSILQTCQFVRLDEPAAKAFRASALDSRAAPVVRLPSTRESSVACDP
jgi:hypothetical protein